MKTLSAVALALIATPALAEPVWQYQQLIVSIPQYQCWIAAKQESRTCHLEGPLNDIKLNVVGPFATRAECEIGRQSNTYPFVPVHSAAVSVEIQSVDNQCIQVSK